MHVVGCPFGFGLPFLIFRSWHIYSRAFLEGANPQWNKL